MSFPRMILAAILAAIVVIGMLLIPRGGDTVLKSHLTFYVGDPALSQGGAVIVAGLPIPMEEWTQLTGFNLATDDADNRKRPEIGPQDRLFGISLTNRYTFVELYYPEGGTYGFDFVGDFRVQNAKQPTTQQILVGSGGWTEWATGETHDWPDVTVINISGSAHDPRQSRLFRVYTSDIMNAEPTVQLFEGGAAYTPSDEILSRTTSGQLP